MDKKSYYWMDDDVRNAILKELGEDYIMQLDSPYESQKKGQETLFNATKEYFKKFKEK